MSFLARIIDIESSRPAPAREVAIRVRRSHGDEESVRRLALLDDARRLRGEALVAERDGRPVAAVEVETGRAVADPFERTAATVIELRERVADERRAA
jgi:hypothetical protein